MRLIAVVASLWGTAWAAALLVDRAGGVAAAAGDVLRWVPIALLVLIAGLLLLIRKQWLLAVVGLLAAFAYTMYHSLIASNWQWFFGVWPGAVLSAAIALGFLPLLMPALTTTGREERWVIAVLCNRIVRFTSPDLAAIRLWCLASVVGLDVTLAEPSEGGVRLDLRSIGSRVTILQPKDYEKDSYDPNIVMLPRPTIELVAKEGAFVTTYGLDVGTSIMYVSVD